MSSIAMPQQDAVASTRLYRAVWRWHFYAGLYVAPFLFMLALSGLIMVYGNSIETFLGKKYFVAPGGQPTSITEQAKVAVDSVPGGKLTLFVNPATGDRANVFVVADANGKEQVVAVDPHGPKVLGSVVKDDTWFYWADRLHGSLFIGAKSNGLGDRLIEIAAGLGILLILTGLYMWWPTDVRGWAAALVPNLGASGRGFWRELHQSVGFYLSIVLLFFFVSGLSWAGVWGEKYVQAWSTFPAAKWDNVPLSDQTHASMNHGALKEIPWTLEQTPMPESGSLAGAIGLAEGTPVNLDTVAAFARGFGFSEQFRINPPQDEKGVYTVSADSMDADTTSPTGDHTIHVDQYTGKILADIRFADYPLAGKAMAVGIALHEATMGWWNTILNTLLCVAVMLLSVSGIVMWWKRRPAGSLGAPLYPRNFRIPVAIMVLGAILVILFPLSGAVIAAFAIIDFLLPKKLKEAGLRSA